MQEDKFGAPQMYFHRIYDVRIYDVETERYSYLYMYRMYGECGCRFKVLESLWWVLSGDMLI